MRNRACCLCEHTFALSAEGGILAFFRAEEWADSLLCIIVGAFAPAAAALLLQLLQTGFSNL